MSEKVILAALGVLLLIAQMILIAYKIQEKRETKKLFETEDANPGNPGNPTTILKPSQLPGVSRVCLEHGRKITKIETCLRNMMKQRKEDREEAKEFRQEVKRSFERVFDRIER